MTSYKDSVYTFIDPIRYFKENDPYYWEVDNIPLKQLQQNCLWLKDQISGSSVTEGGAETGSGRASFSELKPYVVGNDNILRVKSGRYTARINDAYGLDRFQVLSSLGGDVAGGYKGYFSVFDQTGIPALLDRFRSNISTSAMSLNGLIERPVAYHAFDDLNTINWTLPVNSQNPEYDFIAWITGTPWPIIGSKAFTGNNAYFDFVNVTLSRYSLLSGATTYAYNLNRMATEFVKQFRGVARTAIVDVPEELTIEIPNFDENDFFQESIGMSSPPTAEVRIDLAFIYSKPIDASATTIQKWSGQNPTKITKPILGIVRGAGVGLVQPVTTGGQTTVVYSEKALDSAGNTQILADHKDQLLTTNGFQSSDVNVHGSFPSPDDLMNLAAVISDKLSANDPQLIGQSILPVAYIVVRKSSTISPQGRIVLTDEDVIDIRPFFRTTELTYGERTGIAAAFPSPSLANPFVTQYSLDRDTARLRDYVNSSIAEALQSLEGSKVVAGGIVRGGLRFGPEGAINNVLINKGLPPAFTSDECRLRPDWDNAEWRTIYPSAPVVNYPNSGFRNDFLDIYVKQYGTPSVDGGTNDYAPLGVTSGYLALFDDTKNLDNIAGKLSVVYCRKRINIDRSRVPWMLNYTVKTSLLNCVPNTAVSQLDPPDSNDNYPAGYHGIFVDKYEDYFIIYVYWTFLADRPNSFPKPWDNRSHPMYSNWLVRSSRFPSPATNNQSSGKYPLLAACTYPSLEYEIVGHSNTSYWKMPLENSGQYPTVILR